MSEQQEPPKCNLRQFSRFITDHNSEGLAVFNKDVPETVPTKTLPIGDVFHLGYATNQTPVDLNQDVPTYQNYLVNNPGITVPGGSVLRVVDIVPGGVSPMHRTVSLDYGVVIEGAVELVLDSGEVRLMQQGDISVQRGTMHLWRNASKTEWSRVLFVLQESKPITVAGKMLGEDYGVGMGDVPASGSGPRT